MKKVILLIVFLSIGGCSNWLIEGLGGASDNIKESKNLKVFLNEYSPLKNPYFINDTITIFFDEIWVEKQWSYTSKYGEAKIYDHCKYDQLIFKKERKWYDFSTIYNKYAFYIKELGDDFAVYNEYISVSIGSEQLERDTLELNVRDMSFFAGDTCAASILGKIKIIKKK